MPRTKVSPASYSTGISTKQVVVESIDYSLQEAVVKDRIGLRHRISLKVQRVGIKPSVMDVWLIDKTLGAWTFAALLTPAYDRRRKVIYTTGPLDAQQIEQGLVDLSTHYLILYIQTSIPSRVRLYTNAPDQVKDLGRGPTTLPAPGMGIVMDYLTASVLLEAPLTPVPHGVSFGTPPSARTPISVTSVNGGPVTVTLTWVSEE